MSDEKRTSVGDSYFVVMADEIVNQDGQLIGRQKLRTLFFRLAPIAAKRTNTHKAPESAASSAARVDLPPLAIPITTTLIIATALAGNDFEKVHHGRDLARGQGLSDIVMNVLTSCGLTVRYVTDWGGHATVIRRISTQLKAPTYSGDTLTLSGSIGKSVEPGSTTEVHVRGTNSLGTHIESIVTISGSHPR
jgi:hypothetical protein